MMDFKKYDKIKQLGNDENKDIFINPDQEIIIEEKIDGANFRFMINKGKVVFGSRTQQLTSDSGEETNVAKNFQRCLTFVKQTLMDAENDKPTILKAHDHLIFYGECCVKHSLAYNWETIPAYLGYDIFCMETGKYLGYDEKIKIFNKLDLPIVPLVKRLPAKECRKISDDSVPESAYYSPQALHNKQAEGIVFKNYESQIFAKYVREAFKEANRETFGSPKKFAENDDEYVLAVYCTNPRIEKIIFKAIDSGEELSMKLMETVPMQVYDDIWEENWKDLIKSNKTINFRNLKLKVTKRVLAVLKQIMVNNTLQND